MALLLMLAGAAQGFDASNFNRIEQPPMAESIGMAANSNDFHVVMVPEGDQITLYLEQFGGGGPISNAQIEVQGLSQSAFARERGDGVYSLHDEWLLSPGKKALVLTIKTSAQRDVLVGVFDLGALGQLPAREPKYGGR